jgi:hypothetical protein
MTDREDLYRNWVGWVQVNLGRDPRVAEIAANAAANAAEEGRGFNQAAEAARAAWNDSVRRRLPPGAEPVTTQGEIVMRSGEAFPRAKTWPRAIFYSALAFVVGLVIYPLVFSVAIPAIGLLGPLVLTLVSGFVIGLFSRSWWIAIFCSWFLALLGLLLAVLALVPLFGGPPLDLMWSLLVGAPLGAAIGGYLGAKSRGAD